MDGSCGTGAGGTDGGTEDGSGGTGDDGGTGGCESLMAQLASIFRAGSASEKDRARRY